MVMRFQFTKLRGRVRRNGLVICLIVPILHSVAFSAVAGEADVVEVKAEQSAGVWRFDVAVRHVDTGWDHYADKWDVVGPDGTVYGTRVLAHPHENEQPFTRSISGVEIPDDINEVTLRAHDKVHGYGGKEITISLPR